MTATFGARRFAREVASVAAGSYVAIALSFVTSVVLTRAIGSGEYGHLALLITVTQFLSFFVSVWTLTGIVHFGAREFAERGSLAETFWSRTILIAPWLVLAAIALVIFAGPLVEFLGIPPWGIWLVFAHFVLTASVGTASSLLQAMERMPRYGAGLVLDRLVALALLLVLARLEALDALRALACYAASSAVVTVFLFASIGSHAFRPVRADRARIRALWRFSLPVVGSSWLGLFGSQWIDFLIIRRFLPLAELGLYALAYQLAGVLQQITSVVSTLILPRYSLLARGDGDAEVRWILGRIVPYWLLGYGLVLAAAIGLAPIGIKILFGDAFAGAAPALALLVVASVALAIFNTFTPLLTAHERLWQLSGVVSVSVAINVGLDLVLVPRFGISGAAAATTFSYAASAILALVVVRSTLHLPALRYSGFALPVLAAYAGSLLDGPPALLAGIALVTGAVVGVVRIFGLRPRGDLSRLFARTRS